MGAELLPSSLDNYVICTSSARPAGRLGLMIFETDTGRCYIHNGTTWAYQHGGSDPVGARVFRNAGFALTVSASVPTLIPMDAKSWDTGNNHSIATGRYTVGEDCQLRIHARTSITAAAASERFIAMICIGGVENARGTDWLSPGTARATLEAQGVWYFSAGEIIDFRVQQSNGTARSLDIGANLTYMDITRA